MEPKITYCVKVVNYASCRSGEFQNEESLKKFGGSAVFMAFLPLLELIGRRHPLFKKLASMMKGKKAHDIKSIEARAVALVEYHEFFRTKTEILRAVDQRLVADEEADIACKFRYLYRVAMTRFTEVIFTAFESLADKENNLKTMCQELYDAVELDLPALLAVSNSKRAKEFQKSWAEVLNVLDVPQKIAEHLCQEDKETVEKEVAAGNGESDDVGVMEKLQACKDTVAEFVATRALARPLKGNSETRAAVKENASKTIQMLGVALPIKLGLLLSGNGSCPAPDGGNEGRLD